MVLMVASGGDCGDIGVGGVGANVVVGNGSGK